MSISSISTLSTGAQALVRQLFAAVDSNQDGQISTAEFGDFIRAFQGGESTDSTAAAATTPSLNFTPQFAGFDPSRAVSAAGTLKYDAYNVLQSYDPQDPTAMKSAFAVLNVMHPGQYELDAQDNLMLTGTADGYIGARPVNRDSDWTNRTQDWLWVWMGYNSAHPGPNGEGSSPEVSVV